MLYITANCIDASKFFPQQKLSHPNTKDVKLILVEFINKEEKPKKNMWIKSTEKQPECQREFFLLFTNKIPLVELAFEE